MLVVRLVLIRINTYFRDEWLKKVFSVDSFRPQGSFYTSCIWDVRAEDCYHLRKSEQGPAIAVTRVDNVNRRGMLKTTKHTYTHTHHQTHHHLQTSGWRATEQTFRARPTQQREFIRASETQMGTISKTCLRQSFTFEVLQLRWSNLRCIWPIRRAER